MPVAGDHAFATLASDPFHLSSCAIDTDGVTWCWGPGDAYWRVDGSPTPMAFETDLRFASVALGQLHACGVTAADVAYCWGSNWNGLLGTGQDWNDLPSSTVPLAVAGDHEFHDVVTGMDFACSLDGLGAVWCWGAVDDLPFAEPTPLASVGQPPFASVGQPPFASLASGPQHACGLTAEGAAWCWGANWYGSG